MLGAATGISWEFMAAVIKELSSHLDDGAAIFSSWLLYLLIAAGAVLSHSCHLAGTAPATRQPQSRSGRADRVTTTA